MVESVVFPLLTLIAVVCAHNLLDISSFHQTLECIEIGLVEVTPGYFLYIEDVAFIFRTAVDGEMLEAGVKLVILLSGVFRAVMRRHATSFQQVSSVRRVTLTTMTTSVIMSVPTSRLTLPRASSSLQVSLVWFHVVLLHVMRQAVQTVTLTSVRSAGSLSLVR